MNEEEFESVIRRMINIFFPYPANNPYMVRSTLKNSHVNVNNEFRNEKNMIIDRITQEYIDTFHSGCVEYLDSLLSECRKEYHYNLSVVESMILRKYEERYNYINEKAELKIIYNTWHQANYVAIPAIPNNVFLYQKIHYVYFQVLKLKNPINRKWGPADVDGLMTTYTLTFGGLMNGDLFAGMLAFMIERIDKDSAVIHDPFRLGDYCHLKSLIV